MVLGTCLSNPDGSVYEMSKPDCLDYSTYNLDFIVNVNKSSSVVMKITINKLLH